jgi:cell division protein FtsI (penicillin-binding protein 3)
MVLIQANIGFFPADNPKYSCAVIIDEPQEGNLYARDVAAPVFRTIADKIFAYDVKLHPSKNKVASYQLIAQQQNVGYGEDFRTVSQELGLENAPNHAGWLKAISKGNSVIWRKLESQSEELPNVKGMTLRDATHLLENKGFKVRYSGIGKVAEYAIVEARTINLILK